MRVYYYKKVYLHLHMVAAMKNKTMENGYVLIIIILKKAP